MARVSPDFFRAMGMPLLRGRSFDSGDAAGKTRVVIIDQSFAREYFPDQDPIGRQINNLGQGADRRQFTIVGVVPTVQRGNFATGMPKRVQSYYPAMQYPSLQTTLLVRTAGQPLEWSHAMRQAVSAVDPTQPVFAVRAMPSWVADSFTTPRLTAILVGLFSGLALLLAALGLYGTVAYMVAQRTREIGIVVGLAGAFAATRLLTALLYGGGATDLLTYLAVIGLLGLAALLAVLVPARRAMKIDPIVALRYE